MTVTNSPIQQKTHPPRCVIVVDSSALFHLDSIVPLDLQSGARNEMGMRYVDVLRFLAEHGVSVVIPELVAVESAGVIDGGDSGRHLYRNDGHLDKCYQFLREAALGTVQGVRMVAAYPATPVGEAVARLRAAYREPDRASACDQMLAVRRWLRSHGKDQGEVHCFEVSRRLYEAKTDAPVFYLSEDYKSYKDAGSAGAKPVNILGLVAALRWAGLLEPAGLRDTGRDAVGDHCHTMFPRHSAADQRRRPVGFTTYGDHPGQLASALAAVRTDLTAARQPVDAVATAQQAGPSRADQFKAKWQEKGYAPKTRDR